MTAATTSRDIVGATPVVIGLIESIGQLQDNELFVSGWARERPAPGAPILAVGKRQTIEGRIWTAWSDRADVGPQSGYTGVIELARPIEAAEVASIRLGSARCLALYEHRTILDQPQAIGLLRAGLPAALVEGQRQRLEQVAMRFDGTDTIASATQPVRVGIDGCVAISEEAFLLSGWLYDPEAEVAAVWLGADSARSRIDLDWVTQPRPDVGQSFAADPRFGLYRSSHVMHGFVALASGVPGADNLHLSVITRDGAALHVPLSARQGAPLPLLRGFLAMLDPDLPSSLDIVDRQIAPVLATIAVARPNLLHHTLGQRHAEAPLTLVIGCSGDGADLAMLLAMLAADANVRDVPIVVAAQTRELAGFAGQIGRAGEAYGLVVGLVHGDGIEDHLDALAVGSAATSSPLLCLLAADRVPGSSGWLAALRAAHGCAAEITMPILFDGTAAASQSSQRQRTRLASDLGCCIIDRTEFLQAFGRAGPCLDEGTKYHSVLGDLIAAGNQPQLVQTVEFLTAGQPQPFARLARRADALAKRLQIPSLQAAE